MRRCEECGRSNVTLHEEGGVFICNHCLVGGPTTIEDYSNMMMLVHEHTCSWHYGAVFAVDEYLAYQMERANGIDPYHLSEAEMDDWAQRCNAFLALAYIKGGSNA